MHADGIAEGSDFTPGSVKLLKQHPRPRRGTGWHQGGMFGTGVQLLRRCVERERQRAFRLVEFQRRVAQTEDQHAGIACVL